MSLLAIQLRGDVARAPAFQSDAAPITVSQLFNSRLAERREGIVKADKINCFLRARDNDHLCN